MNDRERREANDVPGFGRVGGIDDPVARSEYSDDPDTIREQPNAHRERADDRRAAIHALARDGLHCFADILADRDTDTNSDPHSDRRFGVGARVADRDADDPNPAVVVVRPDEPAYAREIDALDGNSVADVNPDYAASGPVATVAYIGDLDATLDGWREADPDALAVICADEDVRTYDFPTARLREADP